MMARPRRTWRHSVQLQQSLPGHAARRPATGLQVLFVYGIRYRTISRNLISNLGYKAILVGIKLYNQGSKLKSCRKTCRKNLRLW